MCTIGAISGATRGRRAHVADTEMLVFAGGVAEAHEGDGQRLSPTKRHEVRFVCWNPRPCASEKADE